MNEPTLRKIDPQLSSADQESFDDLMGRSYKKVFNTAYRLVGNRNDAEDLTQEAFFRAYRGFGEFEGDRPFENWILRIVSRLFLDLLRARRRRIQAVSYDAALSIEGGESVYFDKPDDRPNPEQAVLNETLSEDLTAAIQGLNEEQKQLLILADVQGMPYHDIAELMGKPVGTIRSRLHRVHRHLRAKLSTGSMMAAS